MGKPVKIEVLANAASVERAQKAVENLQRTVARDVRGRFMGQGGVGGAGTAGGGSTGGMESALDAVANRFASQAAMIAKSVAVAAVAIETLVAKKGIDLVSAADNATIALASMLNQLDPANFGTLGKGISGATKLISGLEKQAETTIATFDQLLASTQALMGPALTAGISVERIPALAAMISRAVTTLMPGAPGMQIGQEARALLTGQIGPDAQVAKSLGITGDQIKSAIKAGTLFEFLETKMGAFNTAAELMARTLTGLASNLQDVTNRVLRPAFTNSEDALRSLFGTITDFVKSDTFKTLADVMAKVAEKSIETTEAVFKAAQFLRQSKFIPGLNLFVPIATRINSTPLKPIDPDKKTGVAVSVPEIPATKDGDKYLAGLVLSALMPARGGLASRGLFASFSDWQSNSQALNVAQSQLDILRAIRDQLNKGLKIEEIGGFS